MTDPCSCEETVALREQIETQAARFNETADLLGAANMEVLKLRELAADLIIDLKQHCGEKACLANETIDRARALGIET